MYEKKMCQFEMKGETNMKKIALLLVLVMIGATMLVGCTGEEQVDTDAGEAKEAEKTAEELAKEEDAEPEIDFSKLVQVKGSDTIVNLGQRWAEAFMGKHTEASVAVTGGGSGTGIAALINGTADIAMTSRAMRDKELDQAKENDVVATESIVGRDGIAVVVSNDNPVNELTMADLDKIFRGEVTNWKEFGGNDAEITIYSRDSSSGTFAFFKDLVMDDEEFAKHAMLMPSTVGIVEGIKQDVNGIGYIGLGYLTDEIQAIGVKKDDGAEAVVASQATVNNDTYPISRPLFLYVAGEPEGVVALFMEFVMSSEGQAIVEDIGFIPVQ